MPKIQLDQDIRSVSDFRANAASYMERVKTEPRPLILTQHGKSSAVLIDVEDYQKLLDKVQLLEELSTARKELDNGEGMSHEEFFNELRAKYANSLDQHSDGDIEQAWIDEIKRRKAEIKSGEIKTISGPEVHKAALELLKK